MILHRTRLVTVAMTLVLAACATAEGRASLDAGRIEGVIRHPAHALPAMRVCALSTAPTREPHRCTTTRAGADRYRIDGLPPGDYQVFAEVAKGMHRIGGHVQQVQCIRAPCPEQPKTITVTSGAMQGGIDLTFFDDARADFPALPSQ